MSVKTLDNLPGSSTPQQRRTIVRHEAPSKSTALASRAKKAHSFDDLKTYFKREYLYLHDWTVYVTVSVYGATVPDSSPLFPTGISRLECKYKDWKDLLCGLEICCGISVEEGAPPTKLFCMLFRTLVAIKQESPVNYCQVTRSSKCEIVVGQGTSKCKPCCKVDEKMKKKGDRDLTKVHATVYGPAPLPPQNQKHH